MNYIQHYRDELAKRADRWKEITIGKESIKSWIDTNFQDKWVKFVLFLIVASTIRKKSILGFGAICVVILAPYIAEKSSFLAWLTKNTLPESFYGRETLISFLEFVEDSAVNDVLFYVLIGLIVLILFSHLFEKWCDVQQEKYISKRINFFAPKIDNEGNWFKDICSYSIHDLGQRYSHSTNFRIPRMEVLYKALTQKELWISDFHQKMQKYVAKTDKILSPIDSEKDAIHDIDAELTSVINEYNKDNRNYQKIFRSIENIQNQLLYVEDVREYEYDDLASQYKEIREYSGLLNLCNVPVLYIKGEAGSGKSHLIADLVTERIKRNLPSVLLLGQKFATDSLASSQIVEQLDLKCGFDDFLDKLNEIGRIRSERVFIFVDALNEGHGYEIWPRDFMSLKNKVLAHEWLGIVVSARTFMGQNILDRFVEEGESCITHNGYEGAVEEAIAHFASRANLTIPNQEYLYRDFSNPLFLKTYCETCIGRNLRIRSYLDIVRCYTEVKNESICRQLKIVSTENYAGHAMECLADMGIESGHPDIEYRDYCSRLVGVLPQNVSANQFVDLMVSEGLLLVYRSVRTGVAVVYFNFEKMGGYIMAHRFIDTGVVRITKTFIAQYIAEAYAILFSIEKGKELFEIPNMIIGRYNIDELFWSTLGKRYTLTDAAVQRIAELIRQKDPKTFDVLPDIVWLDESELLVDAFCRWMHSMPLSQRDIIWSAYLACEDSYGKAYKMVLWNLNFTKATFIHCPDRQIHRVSRFLMWIHSTPYRYLRDCTTKLLVRILEDRIGILNSLMDEYDEVNDPYIRQRLYAVALGVVLRSKEKTGVFDLAMKVYDRIFNVQVVPMDILLRDYARNIIEYAFEDKVPDSIDLNKVRPPYDSIKISEEDLPSVEYINEKYESDYHTTPDKEKYYAEEAILVSMATEYSVRTKCHYGDFGRYVFQSAVDDWDIDPELLSNYAIRLIFEKYGYKGEDFAFYDNTISRGRTRRSDKERIGKKYQWIAMYETIAVVADNFEYEGSSWSAVKEYMGTWEPHVRDIDPTVLYFRDFDNEDRRGSALGWLDNHWADIKVKEKAPWLSSKDGMNKKLVKDMIAISDDDGVEWIQLFGYNTYFAKSHELYRTESELKGLWTYCQAYIVPKLHRKSICKRIAKKGTQGRSFHELRDGFYELFYKDYYSTASYKDFMRSRSMDTWSEFDGGKEQYQFAYLPYHWSEQLSVLRLNKMLFDDLKLKDGYREGEYYDEEGVLVAFDSSVNHKNQGLLLVRKDRLIQLLRTSDYDIVWTILCEKQTGYIAMVGEQFGGVAYLDKKGRIKCQLRLYVHNKFIERLKNKINQIKPHTIRWYYKLTGREKEYCLRYVLGFKKF